MSRRLGKTYKSVDDMIASGYARTSNSSGTVSRIDREDWREYMASKHAFGMRWVEVLERQQHAADMYRRLYSQDKIEKTPSYRRFPSSCPGPQEFMKDKCQ